MVGAAISTAASYVVLFVTMTVFAQSVYRVRYQWRRIATAVACAVGLTLAARVSQLSLAPSVLLVVAYPLMLLLLGFYQAAELAWLRGLVLGR
jgi:hypothetical protein